MQCLQSLYDDTANPAAAKSRVAERAPGTCEWFLRHEKFVSWLDEDSSSLLWVSGDPGCGKTVLSSFLIDHLRTTVCAKKDIVCFFFCNDNVESLRQAASILRATLHIIFSERRDLLRYAVSQFESKREMFAKDLAGMWSILLEAIEDDAVGNVYCVIDALNECEDTSRTMLLKLISNYFNRTTTTGGHLKLLITSRPDLSIADGLESLPSSRLRAEDEHENISRDVESVVKYSLKQFARRSQCSEGTLSRLERQLISNADKTFLWVALTLEALLHKAGRSEEKLMKLLDEMPKQLEDVYEGILSRIPIDSQEEAINILSLTITAVRPLTLEEMNMALGVKLGDISADDVVPQLSTNMSRDIQAICGPFIRIHDGKVYLIHQTAKEFLVGTSDTTLVTGSWKHSFDPAASHLLLARSSVSLLQFSFFEECPLVLTSSPYDTDSKDRMASYLSQHVFLEYAARFWPFHFRHSQDIVEEPTVMLAMHLCDTNTRRFWTWFQIHWVLSEYTWGPPPHVVSPLLIAAYNGHDAVMRKLLEQPGVIADTRDEQGRTPFSWACHMGHESVVRLMIDRPDVDANSKDERCRTPLAWAAILGQLVIVQLLADREDVETDSRDTEGWTPLCWAAMFGQLETVRYLANHEDVDASVKDMLGRTPLALAAMNGHETVVAHLASRSDVSVDDRDSLGKTPLLRAAQEGQDSVVQLLLSRDDVNPDSRDEEGRSPLSWAAGNGHEHVAQLLLNSGRVDLNAKDNAGMTPLSRAAQRGYMSVAKTLIECGAAAMPTLAQSDHRPSVDPVERLEQEHEAVMARNLVAREQADVEYLLRYAPSWAAWDSEHWYHTVEGMLAARAQEMNFEG